MGTPIGLIYHEIAIDEQQCTQYMLTQIRDGLRSLKCNREQAEVIARDQVAEQRYAFMEMVHAFGSSANDPDFPEPPKSAA